MVIWGNSATRRGQGFWDLLFLTSTKTAKCMKQRKEKGLDRQGVDHVRISRIGRTWTLTQNCMRTNLSVLSKGVTPLTYVAVVLTRTIKIIMKTLCMCSCAHARGDERGVGSLKLEF